MTLGGFALHTRSIATRTMAKKNTKQATAYRDLCDGPSSVFSYTKVTIRAIANVITETGAAMMISQGATAQYWSRREPVNPKLPRYTYTIDDQNGSRPKPRY